MSEHTNKANDWYWAASRSEPAGDRFIIENGQDALWPRVRREIDRTRDATGCQFIRMNKGAQLEDILDMLITVSPTPTR
jgi:hypothetical protein